MCGIVGIVNLNNKNKPDRDLIKTMTELLYHRGPDDSGIYVDGQIALGHRRLKIIDLTDNARQPMFNREKTVGIVYNGEIYNFIALRKELEQMGFVFFSRSDTEVILNAYISKGISCINDFVGMYAFAIYDKKGRKFFIVRDRLGIKPLYYTLVDGRVIFASEIKSILTYPGFKIIPDYAGISSYLSYRYPLNDLTTFKNIYSLPPGQYIEIDLNKKTLKRETYYELPINPEKYDPGLTPLTKRLKDLLFDSIRYRMISDVPLGAYLSGGLDSSIVVAGMAQFSNNRIKTFNITFVDDPLNESHYAKLMASTYKTEHHEIVVTKDNYFENLIQLIRYKDSPLSVPNEAALYIMSKELKKHITVVLSGEGADEIFGGYGRIFRSPFDLTRLKKFQTHKFLSHIPLFSMMNRNLYMKYNNRVFNNEIEHFLYLYQYMKWEEKTLMLSRDLIEVLDKDAVLNTIFERLFKKIDSLNPYDKYMWVFEKIHLPGLLQRLDTATMAASVEGRVPFVDHRVVEYALSIPFYYKLRWKSIVHKWLASLYNADQVSEKLDITKYILKKAFSEYIPGVIIKRNKVGFPVPLFRWLDSDLVMDILRDRRTRMRGIYNSNFIGNVEKQITAKSLNGHESMKIWMLVNLEIWFREYIDR